MKRTLLLALALLLCLSGCAARTPEERITDAVETLYTRPDRYHREHYSELTAPSSSDAVQKASEAWQKHNRDGFRAGDFSEGLLDRLAEQWTANVEFLEMPALDKKITLFPMSVTVERSAQSEDLYHFTVVVKLRQESGWEDESTVTGSARIDGKGLISELRLLDSAAVSMALQDAPYPEY